MRFIIYSEFSAISAMMRWVIFLVRWLWRNFIIPEVCVFFRDQLMRGNRVTKTDSEGLDAFHTLTLDVWQRWAQQSKSTGHLCVWQGIVKGDASSAINFIHEGALKIFAENSKKKKEKKSKVMRVRCAHLCCVFGEFFGFLFLLFSVILRPCVHF